MLVKVKYISHFIYTGQSNTPHLIQFILLYVCHVVYDDFNGLDLLKWKINSIFYL